jgi:hypothetical protein
MVQCAASNSSQKCVLNRTSHRKDFLGIKQKQGEAFQERVFRSLHVEKHFHFLIRIFTLHYVYSNSSLRVLSFSLNGGYGFAAVGFSA